MSDKNKKFRILPFFIFVAVLMLSLRINNLFDALKNDLNEPVISLSASQAFAEEKNLDNDTRELNDLLEKSDSTSSATNTGGKTFSQSEIEILQELAQRREALDVRSQEIDKKTVQLKVTEEEIAKKISQLQSYEKKLRDLMREYTAKEKEKINALVKVYSSMKPKDAARIFNTLDLEITTALAKEMKPSVTSAILSQMDEAKAKEITDALIGNSLNISGE